jgi:hypothetical protein
MSRTPRPLPPVGYLRECFDYNPETGVLVWRTRSRGHFPTELIWRMWNNRYAGRRAGWIDSRYARVRIDDTKYYVQRIVVKLTTGGEPPETIDHRDRDKLNNCRGNLRPATRREQNWNSARKIGASGFRGAHRSRKRWRACIRKNGVTTYLGMFDTPEEASAAYETAARELHGDFYRNAGPGPFIKRMFAAPRIR